MNSETYKGTESKKGVEGGKDFVCLVLFVWV